MSLNIHIQLCLSLFLLHLNLLHTPLNFPSIPVIHNPPTSSSSSSWSQSSPNNHPINHTDVFAEPTVQSDPDIFQSTQSASAEISQTSQSVADSVVVPSSRPPNTHPRSKSGIHLPRVNPSLLLTHSEPKNVKQALTDPNWLSAMKLEYEALIKNHTWDLVTLPSDRKAIGCKWQFRVKENADGSINKI